MRVQNVDNNLNFGMPVHVNIPKVKRCLGNKIARDISEALPRIENMAKDVDVVIKPVAWVPLVLRKEYIGIIAQRPNLSLFEKLKSALSLRPPYKVREMLSGRLSSSDRVIQACNDAVTNLLNYTM